MSKLSFNNLKCKQSRRCSSSAAITVASSYLRREHAALRKPCSPYLRMASDAVSSQCWDLSPEPEREIPGFLIPLPELSWSSVSTQFCSLTLHMTEKGWGGGEWCCYILSYVSEITIFFLYRITTMLSA